ncbi:MAG: hypothetical protein ACTSU8_05755 [Alphaproteobacteria bacterium]
MAEKDPLFLALDVANKAILKWLMELGHEWHLESSQGGRISKGEIIYIVSNQPPRREPDRYYYIVRMKPPGVVEVAVFRQPTGEKIFDKAELID